MIVANVNKDIQIYARFRVYFGIYWWITSCVAAIQLYVNVDAVILSLEKLRDSLRRYSIR